MSFFDIIIIGGGASGMMCAIKAKENHPDKKVVILEKQNKIGRKLLSTGNGRCNLYNIDAENTDYYHGSFSKQLKSMFNVCSVNKVSDEFSKLGLVTHSDSEGRVYPYSNHAGSVLDVLRYRLSDLQVDVMCGSRVVSVTNKNNKFNVSTENDIYSCNKLIVSTGSPASPKLGSDESGVSILKKLGHKTIEFSPALCPLEVVDNTLMSSLKGIRQKGSASLFDGNNFIKSETGEIQFTENSLSGICLFNLSSYVKALKKPVISLNLNPFTDDYGQLNYVLKRNADKYKTREIRTFLDGIFANKLGIAIMKEAGINKFNRKISELTKPEIESICDIIYDWRFKVTKPTDFNKAQVCSGGVFGDEINPKTMQSKLADNLYICGEAVDINGDCGGFNLFFAFTSGIIAGESI